MSRTVWGRAGCRSLSLCRRPSARSARHWFFSASLTRPLIFPLHDFLAFPLWAWCRFQSFWPQTWIAVSILLAISRAWCSDDRSKQSSRHSGENCSAVMYR